MSQFQGAGLTSDFANMNLSTYAAPNWQDEVQVSAEMTQISQTLYDQLPECGCGNKTKARYICMMEQGVCKGSRYYCEEYCMTRDLHNHLPDRITEHVTKIE